MTTTDLDTARERDRLALLDQLDTLPPGTVPCRTGDLYTTAAWISDEEDVQRGSRGRVPLAALPGDHPVPRLRHHLPA